MREYFIREKKTVLKLAYRKERVKTLSLALEYFIRWVLKKLEQNDHLPRVNKQQYEDSTKRMALVEQTMCGKKNQYIEPG